MSALAPYPARQMSETGMFKDIVPSRRFEHWGLESTHFTYREALWGNSRSTAMETWRVYPGSGHLAV